MRKLFSILFMTAIIGLLVSCSKSDFTSKYPDPTLTTSVSCPRLMTGVFYSGVDYTFNSYTRIFRWDYAGISRFAQTLGFYNTDGRYVYNDGYLSDRWNNFYNVLGQYRALEANYDALSDDQKEFNLLYVLCARIFVYDNVIQMTECWGDIPFSKAGYYPITGVSADATPAYDKSEDIYTTVLNDLKTINSQLATIQSSSNVSILTSALKTQDYINKGSIMKWRKYCNSLRLRAATDIADNGSLTALGQAAIKEILSDAATYPLVDSNSENISIATDNNGFSYSDQYQSGWETWVGELNRASQAMVDALNGDPRISVMFDKNKSGNYVGMDTHTDYTTQNTQLSSGTYYSAYDSATYSRNSKLPANILSAAEVAFDKANAYNKGYATGDAKAAFIQGLFLSTNYIYGVNASSNYRIPVPAPDSLSIVSFASTKWEAATSKDQVIATQMWLNFNWIQNTQAWTVVRRTGYPSLYFPTDNGSSVVPNVPVRLRYPSTERAYNASNVVTADDNWTTKMFWAKP